MKRISLLIWVVAAVFSGCHTPRLTPAIEPGVFITLGDSIQPDPAAEQLIAPYRTQLEAQTQEVIGNATNDFTNAKPEGTLGNLFTDAMLWAAQQAQAPADIAYTNSGGLRVPLQAGPIQVGEVFEIMPFENRMVVLTLTGAQVDSLAQDLASINGEPVAGIRFVIQNDRATQIEIGGAPLDRTKTYRVVTSDYLADGGSKSPVVRHPVSRQNLTVLLRDASLEYIRAETKAGRSIVPKREGRIRKSS